MWWKNGRVRFVVRGPHCRRSREFRRRRGIEMRARDLLRIKFVSAAAVVCIVSGGCTVGPNYKKPVASVPPTFRGLTDEEAAKNLAASQGDQKWWEVYQDQQLQELIRIAVKQNFDVRIAGTRILAAQ